MISNVGSNLISNLASNLFSRLDTKNQGYLEKSDLESAFSTISDSSNSSTVNVDDLFGQLDGDSDGKVTKDEMTTALENVFSQLNSQFDHMRTQGGGQGGPGGMNGMPPPPPPQDDAGFTEEELTSQLQEIGTSDSKRSELINKIVNNFSEADSDGDGRVSFKEAMAYDQSTSSSSDSTASSAASSAQQTSADNDAELQILQLLQAYLAFGSASDNASSTSTVSVSA